MKRITFGVIVIMLILAIFQTSAFGAEKPQTVSVGIPVEEHPELFVGRSMPTHGDAGLAVFLIEFPDYKNEDPAMSLEYYNEIYFGKGNIDSGWGKGTVASFFEEESYGKLNVSGKVFGWYTAKHERSYYDNKKAELIIEAAEYYRAKGEDFSRFDCDGDGIIDALTYHFAGPASDNRDDPWYGGVNYGSGKDTGFGKIGDLKLTKIAQIESADDPQSNFIVRVICHELMHSLGMHDLYTEASMAEIAKDIMTDNHRLSPRFFAFDKIGLWTNKEC